MQISLHHMYKCITWLFTYFPFKTLILQLNTHTPTEKKTKKNTQSVQFGHQYGLPRLAYMMVPS